MTADPVAEPVTTTAAHGDTAGGTRTGGAFAVVGVVAAFSLSSTLVKGAESPGVLLAFWRMAIVSVVWNLYLRSTGRSVGLADLRQVAVPGVFLGLDVAMFFVSATHNSVANAALIGSMAPFLIVPIASRQFGERIHPAALSAAMVAFGGLCLVLFSAPAAGDASLQGNIFGVIAMMLWTGYVVSTRHVQREMDVATFMATITPVATLAVLPLAIAHGDVFGLSGRGWTYTLILAFLTGVVAHGLNVFAQRTIAIGTIAIVGVAQPPLAIASSALLLGERVNSWQVIGIVVVLAGLLTFTVANQGRHAAGAAAESEPLTRP